MAKGKRAGWAIGCAMALAIGGAIGCDDDDEVGTAARDGGAGTAGGGGGGGTGVGGAGGTTAAGPLNDARIAGIMIEANAGEVHAAELAKSRSRNPEVIAFADLMIDEHASATMRMQQLLDQKAMSTEDSDQRRALGAQAMQVLDQLWAAPAASFDAAYAESQVTMHELVLAMLDGMMIPAAQDTHLKAELEGARSRVASHLTHAQQLEAEVGSAGGRAGGTGGGAGGGAGAGAPVPVAQ